METTVLVLALLIPVTLCGGYWLGVHIEREQQAMNDHADLTAAHQAGRDEVVEAVRDVMRREHFFVNEAPVTAHRHLTRELARLLPDPITYDEEARTRDADETKEPDRG